MRHDEEIVAGVVAIVADASVKEGEAGFGRDGADAVFVEAEDVDGFVGDVVEVEREGGGDVGCEERGGGLAGGS